MSTIVIVHGSFGNPQENWFPWLKQKLELLGHKVFVPLFPTPDGQSLEAWRHVFENVQDELDENTIFVGHSLGPAFILDVLEKSKAKAAFFVSAFIGSLDNSEFDSVNKTFYKQFNWEKIKQNCSSFTLFHSNNDPYVPVEKAKEVADKLTVPLNIIKNAGHFNESAGYTQFPQLLFAITSFLN